MVRGAISGLRGYVGTSSVSLDGTGNGYVLVANNSNLNLTTDFTIFLWVKITAYGASGYEVLERGDIGVTTTGSYKIFISSTGKLRFTDVNVVDINDSSSIVVPKNVWVPVAISHTGTNYNFYINGIKTSTVTNSNNCTTNTRALVIGRRSGSTPNAFSGNIGGVGIWTTALSATQIANLGIVGTNIPTANLSIYLPLTEATGTSIHDVSGKGNTGTLTGSGYSLSTSNTPFPARAAAATRSNANGRSLV